MPTKKELVAKAKEEGLEVKGNETKQVLQEKLNAIPPTEVSEREDIQYILSDQADDEQILAQLEGKLIDAYVYEFESQGKKVRGLSKAGVDESCRMSAEKKGVAFRVIGDPQIIDDGEHVNVIVKAARYNLVWDKEAGRVVDEVLIDTHYGAKRQWKKFRLRGGKLVDDPFYFEKALSKAERNAKMALLPHKYITEMVGLFRDQGKVKQIEPAKTITDKQMKWLHAEAKKVGIEHDQLKGWLAEKGYDSVNNVLADQVEGLVAALKKEHSTVKLAEKIPDVPSQVVDLCNEMEMMPAKIIANYNKFISKYGEEVGTKELIRKLKEIVENRNIKHH